jgi:soluble lytic murein transglycosylase
LTPTTTGRRSAGTRSGTSSGRRRSRAVHRGRLVGLLVTGLLLVLGVSLAAGLGPFDEAVREIVLPLKHEDVIRQQARAKDLDPALLAAVIYEESRFRDQTSPAGAKGLMQLTPETAHFIAQKSGGSAFELRDLATPQVNIAYGAWYLRYLRGLYDGDETLAVAAYNAGETNVDRWVAAAGGIDSFDPADDIPFKETRDYVADVAEKRELYRRHYKRELGL